MRALTLFVCSSLIGCASPPELLVSQGRLGYLSDRADEINATIEARATVDRREGCERDVADCVDQRSLSEATRVAFAAVAERHRQASEPLFPERARVEPRVVDVFRRADGRLDLRLSLDVTSFARRREHPARPWVYASDGEARFVANDPAALSAPSPLAALAERGSVEVAVLLGQIASDPGSGDPAAWSRGEVERALGARGFSPDGASMRRRGVRVVIAGPDELPLSTERAAERVAAAFRGADVVYVNGHARSGLLAKVAGAERPSLVLLDLCWSYYLDARDLRAAAPRAALVVTDGVVVTGSVDGVGLLVDGLSFDEGRDGSYAALLARLNDAAEQRAAARRGQVEPDLAEPEVYGVIP